MNYSRALIPLVAAAMLAGAVPVHAQAQRAPSASREPVTLNFANAEIEAVARTMGAITGRNVVVDPRVKGTMSLSTERPVTPQAAFNQFVATLRLSGFTVVEAAGLYKVVPEADAKLQGGAVSISPSPAGPGISTQIFRLNYETANNLVPILRPLISPNNTINVNPGNNSLVITDYWTTCSASAASLRRWTSRTPRTSRSSRCATRWHPISRPSCSAWWTAAAAPPPAHPPRRKARPIRRFAPPSSPSRAPMR